MPGDLLTLREAAERLGVSTRRARALVEHQQLQAQKLGRQWLVSADAVRQAQRSRQDRGRPIRPGTAWSSIEELPGILWGEVDVDSIRRRLLPRARHVDMYIHPGLLKGITEKCVLGGRGAAALKDMPFDEGALCDLYIKESELGALVRESKAREVLDSANVRFHIVRDDLWPFKPIDRAVNLWVAWLDLADRDDRAADSLLERLIGGRRHD
jgi:excisionase family DNA binding protein